ncbi:MAG TPA: winged helix-turn-helix transcriptional regulator [Candidatus Thermoplasmatota archaeon]|nr:winged helix-turn-helix transcriptional regulator [Candidatus Thermoplasmatota archaeon]
MDTLDVRLLRALGTRPFMERPRDPDMAKPTVLARRLGVTRNTVRARLRALEKTGVVAGYQAVPNLRLLGLNVVVLHAEVGDEARKTAWLQDLGRVEGIRSLGEFMGRHVCFELYSSNPEEHRRRLEFACRTLGADRAQVVEESPMPAPSRAPTSLDWRIIHALRGQATRPLAGLARSLKVSSRTVRRHYEALVRDGLLDVVAVLDPSRIPSAIPVNLFFSFEAARTDHVARRILAAFADRNLFAHVPPDPHFGHLGMQSFATSAADMEEMRQRGAAIPGVLMVQIMLNTHPPPDEAWLDEAVARMAGVALAAQTLAA